MTGAMNMAMDEALLESVSAGTSVPVLRIYRWSLPTVSIGYAQKYATTVNSVACRELGVDVVRRPTGGRAVLHQDEVTYSVISPDKNEVFPGGILANYRVIAHVLQETLTSAGVEASIFTERSHGLGTAGAEASACFTAPGTTELVFQGVKMTGGAQKRQGAAFLQHGSIPLEMNLEMLFRVLDTEGRISPQEGAQILRKKVGWINRWLNSAMPIDVLENLLIAAFLKAFGLNCIEDVPTLGEMRRCQQLHDEKYCRVGG